MINNLLWYETLTENRSLEVERDIKQIKYYVWLLGCIGWIIASTERAIAIVTNPHILSFDLSQLFIPLLLLSSWLYLKPEIIEPQNYYARYYILPNLDATIPVESQKNLLSPEWQLKQLHIISQEYILPFPYFCQIYHLLSLKHLETIHKLSLNNLKVIEVTNIYPTPQGGKIKFTTALESPWSILNIWRKPIVEVDLILHNAYTIELSIPVHQDKRIVVVFNALPLTDNEHYLFIDIYSDLPWFRPFLQIAMHLAAAFTLWEDLSYLRSLQEQNIERLFFEGKFPQHKKMWLYSRFAEICSIE